MTREGDFYVYILTNRKLGTLYVGITNNLDRRLSEHRAKLNPTSFASRYNLNLCVYYEHFRDSISAIEREKEIKPWNRARKIALIEHVNPEWKDVLDG